VYQVAQHVGGGRGALPTRTEAKPLAGMATWLGPQHVPRVDTFRQRRLHTTPVHTLQQMRVAPIVCTRCNKVCTAEASRIGIRPSMLCLHRRGTHGVRAVPRTPWCHTIGTIARLGNHVRS
jgi:hypothetical protein